MKLVNLKTLYPHEETDPVSLAILLDKINQEGQWTNPLIIDRYTRIIMDGHHRYNVAVILGFSVVPCYETSYSSKKVTVLDWKTGEPFCYKRIIDCVKSGRIFPPKTTRHYFTELFDKVRINLDELY
ncbi:ParB N-terminal domain-containing protein [Xenorhabdus sp. IM139775]|uniref:ParB N-terminal domain-containing protein n=1 Tax=Xenorhabdus sp. IM139775 TaxID=3025876 RepID=UPI002358F379|nr:ParB N-terminal domain-containing protein [Xenorhabdus sp. IM139775]MDC9594782.1 transcriptional regulator [Xenorhabdus sp. IM139775]